MIVIINPLPDPFGQLGWCIVVIQQDQVLHRPMITFDLPLGHGMIGFCPNMPDLMALEILLQLMGDEAGSVVADQRPVRFSPYKSRFFCLSGNLFIIHKSLK